MAESSQKLKSFNSDFFLFNKLKLIETQKSSPTHDQSQIEIDRQNPILYLLLSCLFGFLTNLTFSKDCNWKLIM